MTFWGIVVAAGRGSRFGGPKHTALLAGTTLWEHGRAMLAAAGASDVVVVGDVPGGVPGGERRRDSVSSGLAAVPDDVDFVLVHDAARPLATIELARRVAAALETTGADAVIPVVTVTDAVKELAETGVRSVDRSRLLLAQTPQGFRRASLRAAHDEVEGDVADDAELVERWGGRVATVSGESANIKITVPSDLVAAAALLS